MSFLPLQAQNFSLAGAGAVAGATTVILKSFAQINGTLITMADFGAIGYMTLEPGNNTLEEQISFTGVVQNSNGTATLTGVKSVLMDSPYTETSGLAQTHAGSTTAVLSNTSGYYGQFGIKQNNETITAQWSVPTPLSNTAIANKLYVDNVAGGGPVTTNAVTVAGTAGENLTAGNLVYFKVADGLWYKTDADASGTTDLIQIGIVQSTTTTGNPIVSGVMIKGIDANQSGLTPGTIYYLSGTAGAISSSAGTFERAIGQGNSTTSLLFDPDFYNIPTAGIKAASAPGGDYGTPSLTNPYISYNYAAVKPPVIRQYLAAGSPATWTKPAGLKYVVVEVVGAGGGGGARTSSDGTAGGGGGGGYSKKIIPVATLGATETVTTGAVGAGGTTSGNGAAGGNSSFGAHATANGGGGGINDKGAGGAGGTAASGDINMNGMAGRDGHGYSGGTILVGVPGMGGASPMGFGPVTLIPTADLNGVTGSGFGSGGSGSNYQGASATFGGDGAAGVVRVIEYYT